MISGAAYLGCGQPGINDLPGEADAVVNVVPGDLAPPGMRCARAQCRSRPGMSSIVRSEDSLFFQGCNQIFKLNIVRLDISHGAQPPHRVFERNTSKNRCHLLLPFIQKSARLVDHGTDRGLERFVPNRGEKPSLYFGAELLQQRCELGHLEAVMRFCSDKNCRGHAVVRRSRPGRCCLDNGHGRGDPCRGLCLPLDLIVVLVNLIPVQGVGVHARQRFGTRQQVLNALQRVSFRYHG